MKIAILSDTHGWLDDNILKFLHSADEIWHAGDIGSIEVYNELKKLSGKLRAVRGNIDDHNIRQLAPEVQHFKVDKTTILVTHIAGNPPKYNPNLRALISQHKPNILVCGHSHILKIMNDQANNLLFINPGACGHHGIHKMRTLVQFEISGGKPQNMKVIELGKRGRE